MQNEHESTDIIRIDRCQPAGGKDQRQRANEAQRDGEIVDVIIVLTMTPRKPASANDNDGKGVGHHTENEKQRVRKPGTGDTA